MIRCLLALLLVLQCTPVSALADIYGNESAEPERQGPVPRYEPDREALRSVLLPGWSQARQGATNASWAYATIAAVTFVFMIGVFEVPVLGNDKDNFGQVFAGALYGMNAVLSGFDAYNRAAESNRENGWDLGAATGHGVDRGVGVALVRLRF